VPTIPASDLTCGLTRSYVDAEIIGEHPEGHVVVDSLNFAASSRGTSACFFMSGRAPRDPCLPRAA
jgi:hypothetical protein